ncbi:MAG: DNA polymerase III subunit beta [Patescibacteria group bacterium]
MKIICKQENLIAGLHKVAHLTGRNLNLPILNNILLKADNVHIELLATNLEIGIRTQVRGKVEEGGRVAIPAKILTDYIALIDDNENISIEFKDDKINVFSSDWQTKIKVSPAEDYPLIPEIEEKGKIKLKVQQFKRCINQILFAASTDETRQELTGVLIWFKESEFVLAATDSYRLAEKTINLEEHKNGEEKIIVPIKTMQELVRILDDNTEGDLELFIDDNQIKFSFKDTILISRLIESSYPNYKDIIPLKFGFDVEFKTIDMIKAVKASSLFAKSGIFDVTLHFKDNEIVIKSINSQVGENVIKVKSFGNVLNEQEVVFNYKYLLDGLNNMNSEKTKIFVNTPNTPVVFKPSGENNYTYLIMPIRQ